MNKVNNFSKQLKILGVSVQNDKQFKFEAIHNLKTNAVIYNSDLLTQKKASEIIQYVVANIHK